MTILAGRRALVTGGSRGIGRAIVERLAEDGATVVFSYCQDAAAAAHVSKSVEEAGGRATAVQADISRPDDVRRLFAEADSLLGGLDIVVNNAGTVAVGTLADASEEAFDTVMDANVRGTFFALQEAARRLNHAGRIVNVSSVNTVLPVPGNALYSASKAAVEQFSAVAAKELGERQITVNTVSPGATDTDMLRGANPPEALERIPGMTPLGRLGEPRDIADVVAFLASDDARWITGQNLRVSGGLP
ncbi:MAG: glucose 1-dehydrogenase [Acidimicrobiales bacterium]